MEAAASFRSSHPRCLSTAAAFVTCFGTASFFTATAVASPALSSLQTSDVRGDSLIFDENQSASARVTTYGLTHGLAWLSLNALAIDSQGTLWIGTSSGLYSYDGSRFRALPAEQRELLQGERISALHRDRRGVLWVGVGDGRLVQILEGEISVPAELQNLASVRSIFEASDGSLWFGGEIGLVRRTPTGGIDRLRCPAPGRATAIVGEIGAAPLTGADADERFRVGNIAEDPSDGSIWIAGYEKLMHWTGGTVLDVVHDEQRTGLFFDSQGRRWELSVTGAVYCDGEQHPFDLAPSGRWAFVRPLGGGRHLIGSQAGNFVFTDGKGPPSLRELKLRTPIRALVSDRPGNVWLATSGDGLLFVEDQDYVLVEPPVESLAVGTGRPFREVIELDDTRALINRSVEDGVLVLTPPSVLGREPQTELFRSAPGVKLRVNDACLSSDGEILVATGSGLGTLADGRLEALNPSGPCITALVRTKDGHIWARSDDRLIEMNESGVLSGRSIEAPGRWNESIAVQGEQLYLTQGQKLFACDLATLNKREVLHSEGAGIRALCFDREGSLWVTTYGNGLYRLHRTGRLDHWSVEEGLACRHLGWIGHLPGTNGAPEVWINSNRGALKVPLSSLTAVAEGRRELLQCTKLNSGEGSGLGGACLAGRTLVLPTIDGIVAMDSNAANRPPVVPRAFLRSLSINDELTPLGETVEVVGASDIEFLFDIVCLPSSHQVEVQTKLIGHEEHWASAGAGRSQRYTNLGAGDYQFALRARGSAGDWSEVVRSARVTVRRTLLGRTWFRVVAIGCLLAFAALAFTRRTHWLVTKSQILEEEVRRREAAERELIGQRAQFESVLEGAHDGIFAFDASGKILYANPAMHWTFGASSAEIVGARLASLGIPGLDDEESLAGIISSSELRQRWKTLEASALRMDGQPFELEVSIASDVNSEEGCFVGIVRDISDRKQMHERLRDSEERYRSLYETVPMAIIVWNPRLNMLEWNQRATDLFGWSPGVGLPAVETSAIDLYGVIDGEDGVEAMRASVRQVLNGERDCVETVRTQVARGRVHNCRWHLAPLTKPDGTVWAFITTVMDMSQEDRVNREFQSLRSLLARAEESERARIARELHDDLSQRMAAVALDLQLHQNVILGLGEAELALSVQGLREGVVSVATDIHTLSRQLHPTVLDDLGLMSALRSECVKRSKRSGVKITCEGSLGDTEPGGAKGLALYRVVQEALQNALTHGNPTAITVAIYQDGDQLDLTVEDDGGGFSLPPRGRIEASRRRGIGFASMRERMTLVGGTLRVNTMLGTGTVVRAVVSLSDKNIATAIRDQEDAAASTGDVIPGPLASPSVPKPASDAPNRLH